MNAFETVQSILANISLFEKEEITSQQELVADLELDSFTLLDAVLSLEAAFHINIPDKELRSFITVQDVVDYVEANQPVPIS